MSLEAQLFTSLRSIIKKMRKILDTQIAAFNIGHAEMRLLLLVYKNDGCTQEELVSKIEVDRSNVTRALKKLVSLEYITRATDSQDRRLKRIYLTEKGLIIKEPLLKIKNKIEKTIAHQISNEESVYLISLLARIEDGLNLDNFLKI